MGGLWGPGGGGGGGGPFGAVMGLHLGVEHLVFALLRVEVGFRGQCVFGSWDDERKGLVASTA